MAPLALIYDVHGNLPALEAVLADARAADAQRFLLGGDYALFGPFQAECVAALRALDAGHLDPRQRRPLGREPGRSAARTMC